MDYLEDNALKKKKLIIKPMDNYLFHLFLLPMWLIIFGCLTALAINNRIMLNSHLVISAIVILLFVFIRLFYPIKIVIDETELTMYKRKSILFKIKNKDIEKIFVKKGKWYAHFMFIFEGMCNSSPSIKHVTNLSIVFKNCEVFKKDKGPVEEIYIKPKEYDSYFDKTVTLSFFQCIRLCRFLNIPATIVRHIE